MGKLTNTMWRALGAQTSRNQSKSLSLIKAAATHDDWAAELGDEDFPEQARELDLTAATDRPKFLALIREAAERSLELRPFDVQLQAAARILEGDIAEMATGEGKTLAGAIAAVGYVLQGHQVHVISVNDYLAKRDAEWMGPLFELLGISVGHIAERSTREERKEAYGRDVVYASVNEIGFDLLRDQLTTHADDLVSPTPDVAIVDEADSVLVDEALVPLVLAGSTTGTIPDQPIHDVVSRMRKQHYTIDTDGRSIFLTDEGAEFVEAELGDIDLYSEEHIGTTLVQVNIAMQAYYMTERDIHYIVRDGAVKLINASRGRVAELQRWPDGLQAAVELKEGLTQTDAGEVIDTITVQALLQRYPKVAGMTGTALAAGEQLRQFYNLLVSPIPPNTKNVRIDEPDRVYDNKAHKAYAVVDFVAEVHETGQPVLIGTHDVAESEELAHLLKNAGVECVVLNAKNDAEEAAIIAEAGTKGAVTVSTQMAGRGTDIKLGSSRGADDDDAYTEVVELGGLCVVGTGRYDTKRLDDQLRGRAGRQGDPGRSVFFSSLGDPVVTRNLSFKRDPEPLDEEGSLGAKGIDLIEQAQRVAEGVMLEVHANTWRYNVVVNQQRDIVSARRRELLTTDAAFDELSELEPDRVAELLGTTTGDDDDSTAEKGEDTSAQGDDTAATSGSAADNGDADKDDSTAAETAVDADEATETTDPATAAESAATESESDDPVADTDEEAADAVTTPKVPVTPIPEDTLKQAAREIMLFYLDRAWADHLAYVADVQASIHLRSIGRESPLDEFHKLIVAEFSDLPTNAISKAQEHFRTAEITADGSGIDLSDLPRSTLTWTYMVHDNPFTSGGGAKLLQGVVGIFR